MNTILLENYKMNIIKTVDYIGGTNVYLEFENKRTNSNFMFDGILTFSLNGISHTFSLLFKKTLLGKQIASLLKENITTNTNILLVCDFVSESNKEVFKEGRLSFIDFSDNCLLIDKQLYVEIRKNNKNKVIKQNKSNIFSRNSLVSNALLRLLFENREVFWKYKDITNAIKISEGQIKKFKDGLDSYGLLEVTNNGFRINDYEACFNIWKEFYKEKKDIVINCYSTKPVYQIEQEISMYFNEDKESYCFTGYSAAVRYKPTVRYSKVHCYVLGDKVNKLMKDLRLKEVEKGSNVQIIIPYHKQVLSYINIINADGVASIVQTCLDLDTISLRSEEAIEAIFNWEGNNGQTKE